MIEDFRRDMGLDQPIPVQFAIFIGNVITGDLGHDVWTRASVAGLVFRELPHTIALTVTGLGWALLIGIPLGCYSAMRRGGWVDRTIGLFAVASIAVPSFVVGIYSLLIFAVWLRWFPALGAGPSGEPLKQLWYLVLPSFSIGLGWVGYLARLVRASMLEVMGENHIRTARAFGLPERQIVFAYALRIAILPTVSLLGVGVGRLLSGAVFAEIVFNRPGVGKLVYDGVVSRNYPVVMGAVLVTTAIFALSTLTADLAAAQLDPRVRDKL
jgi:peptide/nickel transport system permease protein